jgi:hypothetical protein
MPTRYQSICSVRECKGACSISCKSRNFSPSFCAPQTLVYRQVWISALKRGNQYPWEPSQDQSYQKWQIRTRRPLTGRFSRAMQISTKRASSRPYEFCGRKCGIQVLKSPEGIANFACKQKENPVVSRGPLWHSPCSIRLQPSEC